MAGLALVADVIAANPPSQPTPRSTPQFESLLLTRSRYNRLLLSAYVNGKPASLIVDTGCPTTFISEKRRAYYALKRIPLTWDFPSQVPVNGTLNRLALARSLRLGMLNIVDVPVVVANLAGPETTSHRLRENEADGILGADILFATKAILDCQQQTLILNMFPHMNGRAPGLDFRGFQRVPMYVSAGLNLFIDSSINGSPARLMVDTGSSGTLLHRPFIDHLRIPVRETRFQSAAINLQWEHVDVARLQKFSVGMVNFAGRHVGVTDLGGLVPPGLQSSPPVVGLLGAEILNRHHGIIDFGTRTLYLSGQADRSELTPRRRTPARAGR